MRASRLLWLGLFTVTVFPAIGFIIAYFALDLYPIQLFIGKESFLINLFIGFFAGTLAGLIAKFVITRRFMAPVLYQYGNLLGNFNIKTWHVWFISFCAGTGEEILFRGAFQPLAGIWITAVVFVAIHGYLNPWNWRVTVYGLTMTIIIATIGWMTDIFGLISAITAHMMIDVVLLQFLSKGVFQEVNDVFIPDDDINLHGDTDSG